MGLRHRRALFICHGYSSGSKNWGHDIFSRLREFDIDCYSALPSLLAARQKLDAWRSHFTHCTVSERSLNSGLVCRVVKSSGLRWCELEMNRLLWLPVDSTGPKFVKNVGHVFGLVHQVVPQWILNALFQLPDATASFIVAKHDSQWE